MLFQILFGTGRTQAYTVHEGPSPPTDRMDRAEALRFIKDGFTLSAAIAGPLWLAGQRLWQGLALYVAALAVIVFAYAAFGLPPSAVLIGIAAVHLLIGFEADSIERAALERQGWSSLGAVTGASALECQRRFFDQWLTSQPVLAPKTPQGAPLPPAAPRQPSMTGRGAADAAGRLAALWRPRK